MPETLEAGTNFKFPDPPEQLPQWAVEESKQWKDLDEFDILVQAESFSGKTVELQHVPLSENLWGLHVARGGRARIYVNRCLPLLWRRFALFHELYHLLYHSRGEDFWSLTATPMTSFEHQADMFAWASIQPEWTGGGAC